MTNTQGSGFLSSYGTVDERITFLQKLANETKTSDDTLANDTDIQFNAPANKTYSFILSVMFTTGATPDFQYAIAVPTNGTAVGLTGNISGSAGRVQLDINAAVALTAGAVSAQATQIGRITSGDGGTIALQWAQNTSDAADTILEAASFLMLMELP